jgi:hypothetical protein
MKLWKQKTNLAFSTSLRKNILYINTKESNHFAGTAACNDFIAFGDYDPGLPC